MKKNPPRKVKSNYPLDQSPFYMLNSKKRLAGLLGISLQGLDELLSKEDNNYRVFPIEGRIVEEPRERLRALHKRMQILLNRIKTPDYLHSSIKGRSYITNAKVHVDGRILIKLDIKKFYPSTRFKHVYDFFKNAMLCSEDVATLISRLTTYQNHLPTGSPLSPILGYFAHKKMFDEIHRIALANGIVFTCYVDDLSFSGDKVPGSALHQIKRLIKKRDLISHKDKFYAENQFREVTGVGIKNSVLLLPNRRHKKIYDLARLSTACEMPSEKVHLLGKLISRLGEAKQIESKFQGKKSFLLGLKRKIHTSI